MYKNESCRLQRKKTCLKKFAPVADALSPGERSGLKIGKKLNIVATPAGRNVKPLTIYFL